MTTTKGIYVKATRASGRSAIGRTLADAKRRLGLFNGEPDPHHEWVALTAEEAAPLLAEDCGLCGRRLDGGGSCDCRDT